MDTINLYGASGHGKVIKDIIENNGKKVGIFYDDFTDQSELNGVSIAKTCKQGVDGPLIISIGNNKIRKAIADRYNNVIEFATAAHPSAIVASNVRIGSGSVIMHGAIIQTDVSIGKHCIVNTGASVDHECKIDDFVHISPHATLCGNVKVGEGSWIGAGATVIPGIKIGKWCIIGAGSTVIKDVPDYTTVVGCPARSIKRNA